MKKNIILFLSLTFGITWGIAGIFMLFPEQIMAVFGELTMSNPLFILAVYSPGFAGIFLAIKMHGIQGVHALPSTERKNNFCV